MKTTVEHGPNGMSSVSFDDGNGRGRLVLLTSAELAEQFASVDFSNGYNDRRYSGSLILRSPDSADYQAGWNRAERDIEERLRYLMDEAAAGLL